MFSHEPYALPGKVWSHLFAAADHNLQYLSLPFPSPLLFYDSLPLLLLPFFFCLYFLLHQYASPEEVEAIPPIPAIHYRFPVVA